MHEVILPPILSFLRMYTIVIKKVCFVFIRTPNFSKKKKTWPYELIIHLVFWLKLSQTFGSNLLQICIFHYCSWTICRAILNAARPWSFTMKSTVLPLFQIRTCTTTRINLPPYSFTSSSLAAHFLFFFCACGTWYFRRHRALGLQLWSMVYSVSVILR